MPGDRSVLVRMTFAPLATWAMVPAVVLVDCCHCVRCVHVVAETIVYVTLNAARLSGANARNKFID